MAKLEGCNSGISSLKGKSSYFRKYSRQQEENHIMKISFTTSSRGFNVDVGIVEYNYLIEGKNKRSQHEVDFVVDLTDKRYYIQSALTFFNEEKRLQEVNSLNRIDDSFAKILVVNDNVLPLTDDKGVQYINIVGSLFF